MTLARLGSLHQTRLSFMRSLLRRLKRETWEFKCTAWEVDSNGEGYAVYRAKGPRHTYSLVAFAHDLPAEQRSDRVIATAWDATFCLFDGEPSLQDIVRLQKNVPYQEMGRISDTELCLSRANRSVRLWQHVVDKLSAGEQPDIEQVQAVGYLLRTTAVYGSGKFGAADRGLIENRILAGGPFRVEMLSVYLIRAFSLDLVEHMAGVVGGESAVAIEPKLRRKFGIGNSTGLGMAPFLMNHPLLFHNWIFAREKAFAIVRSQTHLEPADKATFLQFLQRARRNVAQWHTQHEVQVIKLQQLKEDLSLLDDYLTTSSVWEDNYPWETLWQWSKAELSIEGQEQLVSLIIEPYGRLVDELTAAMGALEYPTFGIDGSRSVGEIRQLIENNYAWALSIDFSQASNTARFWYVSEEKLEPRLGERSTEEVAEYEQPLSVGWDISKLYRTLNSWQADDSLADFLLSHAEHRHTVRRVLIQEQYPYSEIQDNTISDDFLPIDMLRCKLSFFGATHFDPRSDRWIRICMYQNAPFPEELGDLPADDWVYPALEVSK